MSEDWGHILHLIKIGKYSLSSHALVELEKDDILPSELIGGVDLAVVVEDYPEAFRGPSVLVMQRDHGDRPIHAVWGRHRLDPNMAVLITAYRPSLDQWTPDFLKRT